MVKTKINSDKFFVIRTPRMSVKTLFSLVPDKKSTQELIDSWISRKEVIEALYLASPSLVRRIEHWRKKPMSKQGKKVEQALLKYLIRMTTRPTPFGLFSGICTGSFDEETHLTIKSLRYDERFTRIDISYLNGVKEYLKKSQPVSDNLIYRPNPSHYYVGSQCRYIESYQSNSGLQYRLSAIESNDYFDYVMELAKNGASFSILIKKFILKYQGASKDDTESFVKQLIDESIIIADIPIPLTGDSPDIALLKAVNKIGARNVSVSLAKTINGLKKLDQKNIADISDYKNVFSHLKIFL